MIAIVASVVGAVILGVVVRLAYSQGVQAGWQDAAESAVVLGTITYRESWIRCGAQLNSLGPGRLNVAERYVAEYGRSLHAIITVMANANAKAFARKEF